MENSMNNSILLNITCIKMAIHHVYMQILKYGTCKMAEELTSELGKIQRLRTLGIDLNELFLQASNDYIGGEYENIISQYDSNGTSTAIRYLLKLLEE